MNFLLYMTNLQYMLPHTDLQNIFCLVLRNFVWSQHLVSGAKINQKEDNDFADVTLVCEYGQQVEAHKVILAGSSPFFHKLLGRNKHPHLIYMRGTKSGDLLAIVEFIYHGVLLNKIWILYWPLLKNFSCSGCLAPQSDVHKGGAHRDSHIHPTQTSPTYSSGARTPIYTLIYK